MQGWMIAMITVAAVVFVVAVGLAIGSFVATKKILGRVDSIKSKETADDYGVDSSWFDEVKANTGKLNIVAYDGNKLAALLIRHDGESVRRVAICQHGYTATPVSVQPFAKLFYDKGYDVLLPYARAHFESEGKYVGMAWLDRFDILRWTDKMIELYGRSVSIVLHGVSMGGSTVVAASGMNPPPQVKCVVDDCGFASQFGEYTSRIEKVRLPKRLILLPLAIGVRIIQGYSIYDANITELAKNSKVPTLFIHGERDAFVPPSQGKELFEACAAEDKSMVTFENAAHAASYISDPEKYKSAVSEFVGRVIG